MHSSVVIMRTILAILICYGGQTLAQDLAEPSVWSDPGDCCTLNLSRRGCSNKAVEACVVGPFDAYPGNWNYNYRNNSRCREELWGGICVEKAALCLSYHGGVPCSAFDSRSPDYGYFFVFLLPTALLAYPLLWFCGRRMMKQARKHRGLPFHARPSLTTFSDPGETRVAVDKYSPSSKPSDDYSLRDVSRALYLVQCAWSAFSGAQLVRRRSAKALVHIIAVLLAVRFGLDLITRPRYLISLYWEEGHSYSAAAVAINVLDTASNVAIGVATLQLICCRAIHKILRSHRWKWQIRCLKINIFWLSLAWLVLNATDTIGKIESFVDPSPHYVFLREWLPAWASWLDAKNITYSIEDILGTLLKEVPTFVIIFTLTPRFVISFRSIGRRVRGLMSSISVSKDEVDALWAEYVDERDLCEAVAKTFSPMLVFTFLSVLWQTASSADDFLFNDIPDATVWKKASALATSGLLLIGMTIPPLLITTMIRQCLLAFGEVDSFTKGEASLLPCITQERKRGAGFRLFGSTVVFSPRLVMRMLYLAGYFIVLSGLVEFVSIFR